MMRLTAGTGQKGSNSHVCARSILCRLCCTGLVASLIFLARPACAQDIDGLIRQAALRVALPPEWIRAVMQVESGRDAHAISAKGAMGLMQIMPATWQGLQHDLGLGADPFDPQDNILAGASYLRMLHDRYGDAGFLAAYNAGPGRYEAHLVTGRPLPQETRDYVASVAQLLDGRTLSADVLHHIDATVARNQPEDTLFAGHVIWRSSGAFPHAPKALADMSQALFVPVSMGPAP
ncbi:lytic transglycosylase domain-containing protein [Komagataeibacter oboediens]|uniref:Lytic transglycosylase domain-containing protein n=1 Tax=Komagataeibacter oboediens TaxID=65958 RepID=A0ABS5SS18_9PROT|nr:lytic transglycosylase domain-containing protein [Komagataeibacter oboediens]MBL7233234.1 lytic transglycosylase domain-containing protein [Komagataeibacter oboediens]MBT0676552.1 lytic transglycosylase domain-containing protein [Komagataeibacter oboediens]MBT0679831.1 lytic transglycosylase domain-containing protein [Komagataeibacter oboediens]